MNALSLFKNLLLHRSGLLPRAARGKMTMMKASGITAGETYYRGSVTSQFLISDLLAADDATRTRNSQQP